MIPKLTKNYFCPHCQRVMVLPDIHAARAHLEAEHQDAITSAAATGFLVGLPSPLFEDDPKLQQFSEN